MLHVVLFILLSLFLAPNGWAQSQDYLALTQKELGEPLILKRVAELVHYEPVRIATSAGVSGATYRTSSEEYVLTLAGKDKADRPWHVDLFQVFGCGAARLYETDLDKDAIIDAVIVKDTCGNGLAPTSHLLTVTFDETGRPIPFEAEGYFLKKGFGIDALVDLDRNGIADFVFMNFSDGYWITNVYSLSQGRWSRIKGHFAEREFPLFTRFTHRPNKLPVKPPPSRSPYAPDLSNRFPIFEGRLVDWSWPDQYHLRLTMQKGDGSRMICTPNYWYDSARMVVDSTSGRRIGHLSYDERQQVSALLSDIVRGQFRVQLYGERDPDRCTPELVWALEN